MFQSTGRTSFRGGVADSVAPLPGVSYQENCFGVESRFHCAFMLRVELRFYRLEKRSFIRVVPERHGT